mmetsp:Transcript_5434/g.10943  ORF Transcript_5434/g.10943 Transcript_5434/m.10943 type:complete len:313 (+) Transcript_5434:1113-2051(+)
MIEYSSPVIDVGMFPVVITVPEASGKVIMLSPVGGVISKVVLTKYSCSSSSPTDEKTKGYLPRRYEWTSRLVGSSQCPMVVLAPMMLVSPSSTRLPSTCSDSTTSGKLPVVMMVPDTSGRKRMFCADGSSTASASVRLSPDLPSKRIGVLPPIGALISREMRAFGCPNAMSLPSNLAPPRKTVSPTKVVPSSTSGKFPVVITVPSTSGRFSTCLPDGSSTPTVILSLFRTDCGLNVRGNGVVIAASTNSEVSSNLSPIVTTLSICMLPRRFVSPTTEICWVSCGIESVVTIEPALLGGNRIVLSLAASGIAQ